MRGARSSPQSNVVRRHDRLGHERRAVASIEAQIGVLTARRVAEQRLVPSHRAGQRLGIGIEQQLVGIEAMAVLRLIGPVDAIAVDQSRRGAREIAVPHLVDMAGHRQSAFRVRPCRTRTVPPSRHAPRRRRSSRRSRHAWRRGDRDVQVPMSSKYQCCERRQGEYQRTTPGFGLPAVADIAAAIDLRIGVQRSHARCRLASTATRYSCAHDRRHVDDDQQRASIRRDTLVSEHAVGASSPIDPAKAARIAVAAHAARARARRAGSDRRPGAARRHGRRPQAVPIDLAVVVPFAWAGRSRRP